MSIATVHQMASKTSSSYVKHRMSNHEQNTHKTHNELMASCDSYNLVKKHQNKRRGAVSRVTSSSAFNVGQGVPTGGTSPTGLVRRTQEV